jgi:hypothetical protein
LAYPIQLFVSLSECAGIQKHVRYQDGARSRVRILITPTNPDDLDSGRELEGLRSISDGQ